MKKKARFVAELIEGHKGITAVIVPFDPQETWQMKASKVDPSHDGWLVRGTMNRVPFDGWIGYRWGRFFIVVEPELRRATKTKPGDRMTVAVEPRMRAKAAKITSAAKTKAASRPPAKRTRAPRAGRV